MSERSESARLDRRLVEIGAFPTRARAQAAIAAGLVRVNGAPATKASQSVAADADISVEGDVHPYVSRGGLKLEGALDRFGVDPAGKICLDLGASTGGFTDVLLRRGAAKVYAVDVGAGQLHESLRAEPRVVSLEKTHAKDLSRTLIPGAIDFLVCDVSFISIRKALPPALALCAPTAQIVSLIKPQFEFGPEKIGKGGMVTATEEEMNEMLAEMRDWLTAEGWRVSGVIESPILGGEGAKEFLIAASR